MGRCVLAQTPVEFATEAAARLFALIVFILIRKPVMLSSHRVRAAVTPLCRNAFPDSLLWRRIPDVFAMPHIPLHRYFLVYQVTNSAMNQFLTE